MVEATINNLKVAELLKKATEGICSCPLKATVVAFCSSSNVLVCKKCIVDHFPHIKSLEYIENARRAKDTVIKYSRKPRCQKHPQATDGYYCFKDKAFKCNDCHMLECIPSKHDSRPFEELFSERRREFDKLSSHMKEVFESHKPFREAVEDFLTHQNQTIDQKFNILMEFIAKRKQEMKHELEKNVESYAENSRLMTERQYLPWKRLASYLEQASNDDFISKTNEESYNKVWPKHFSNYKPKEFLHSQLQTSLLTHSLSFTTDDFPKVDFKLQKETISNIFPFKFPANEAEETKEERRLQLPSTIYCIKSNTAQLQAHHLPTNTKTSYNTLKTSPYTTVTPSITQHNGIIYLCGGTIQNKPVNSLHQFNPPKRPTKCVTGASKDMWCKLANMPRTRCQHGFVAAPDGSYLYVIGGHDGGRVVKSCYRYALCDDHWEWFSDLPVAVCGNGGFCYCEEDDVGKYCIGSVGNAEASLGQVLVYNVSMDDLAFGVGRWEKVDVGVGFSAQGCWTQVGQFAYNEVFVVVTDGRVYSLKMTRGGFCLKRIQKLPPLPFRYVCGFGWNKGKLGLLGDEGVCLELDLE
eukprot:CAMPEP_0115005232 /NCGR_PEP_ID=MMETSP0216-20121206/19731_1 /TAXON_ID=223996 /ORGANISM="Protocruzia adherens, Strain Boccale" /LENGTH=580 /DNA_ID=CAMNT_0002371483 /DNA_START=116 /DNA_END=1858 /DNA_ORIENTATION=-